MLRDPTLAILAMSFSDSEDCDESLEHDLVYVSQLQSIGEKIYDSLTDDDKEARLNVMLLSNTPSCSSLR